MNKIILGTMNIHYPYTSNNDSSNKYYKSIIDKYVYYVGNEPMIDTAYYYGNTKTEQTLGEILPTDIFIATKANPWFENDFTNGKLGQLSKCGIESQLNTSLKNLQRDKVDVFYLHCPDYETPIQETLEKCDELWRTEKFDNLGISNFSKQQLQDLLVECEKYGFNMPKYYQGMYNIICRKVEEIFPILEENDMVFWGYNPLAGGMLTGKYYLNDSSHNNCRYKDNKIYQNIFWKPEIISELSDFFAMPFCLEYSLKWLSKYSGLKEKDKIILGVSTVEQLDNNINIIKDEKEYDIQTIEYLNNLYNRIEEWSPNYYY